MRLVFLFLLSVLSFAGKSQPVIYNHSLTDSTQPYLYIGVDNHVEINWKGLKKEKYGISIHGGGASIAVNGLSGYHVRVSRDTDDCRIRITDKKGEIVTEKIFRVRTIPLPEASLAGFKDTMITRKQVLINPFLRVLYKDCFLEMRHRVVSFTMTATAEGDTLRLAATGNHLSKEQTQLIQNRSTDNKLVFDDIRALSPDGRAIKLPSFWIKLDGE